MVVMETPMLWRHLLLEVVLNLHALVTMVSLEGMVEQLETIMALASTISWWLQREASAHPHKIIRGENREVDVWWNDMVQSLEEQNYYPVDQTDKLCRLLVRGCVYMCACVYICVRVCMCVYECVCVCVFNSSRRQKSVTEIGKGTALRCIFMVCSCGFGARKGCQERKEHKRVQRKMLVWGNHKAMYIP